MTTKNEIRVRFAPSPTGFLHIGGARTALFNWLYARANKGKFLLRIEDTDPTRSEQRFTDDILESMKWLGFDWDEEPIHQSHRMEEYKKIAYDLLDKKMAFRCECTQQDLDALRAKYEKEKKPFRYPGTCRNKTQVSDTHVIRLVMPKTGDTGFTDLIRGPISMSHRDMDDWVILRADKTPTYNFSVVIDDHFQNITHILRGDDHINNTPKQIILYKMLGYNVPEFAHLPMILGPDKSKLSKRHGAASTLEYRKMGYMPLALINFLVRLGWSHGDQEFFTEEELFKFFALDHIGKAGAIFNEEKLQWISGHFLKETSAADIFKYLQQYFPEKITFESKPSQEDLIRGISITQAKVKTLLEMGEQLDVLFGTDPSYDANQGDHKAKLLQVLPVLEKNNFDKASLETEVKQFAESLGLKAPAFSQSIRFGVTGGKVSPGLFDMLEVMGKERVLRRIQSCLQALK